jgi:ankyrin repeat protein
MESLIDIVIQASKNGNINIIQDLLDRGVLDDNDKVLSLINSSAYGRIKIVQVLIKANVDPNARTFLGINSLTIASSAGQIKVVQALLEAGAKIEDCMYNGVSPLMYASGNGHIKVVSLLLKKGANTSSKDCIEQTALIHASEQGHDNIIRLLNKHTILIPLLSKKFKAVSKHIIRESLIYYK